MKIKEIQRKGENLYTVTFEKRTLWEKKEVVRDVFQDDDDIMYAQTGDYVGFRTETAILNLIPHLNGKVPLKVN